MRKLEKLVGIAAGCDATVLIQGETGSGKDTIARAIHKHSRHKGEPLTVIDCTAVPEDYDYFDSLSPGVQGSVLLDEVGDLCGNTQAKLVRALKEAAADSKLPSPRIIATTQFDLIRMVREKGFREDLYYRLNVLPLSIPPLRERGSDILALAETFLLQARSEKKLSSAAAKRLLDSSWPGNVRQLQNLMYHLAVAVRSAVIDECDLSMLESQAEPTDHVPERKEESKGSSNSSNNGSSNSPESSGKAIDYYGTIASVEKKLLTEALRKASGSRSEAARLLGINRQLLYAKLKSHGLMGE
jgi:DNA-binding NtrC family response regulator